MRLIGLLITAKFNYLYFFATYRSDQIEAIGKVPANISAIMLGVFQRLAIENWIAKST